MLVAILCFAFYMPPATASHLAAWLLGQPELGPQLQRICQRESDCSPIGVHERDAHYGRTVYRRAVRVGLLHPTRCVAHRLRGSGRRWSTRGPWGTMAAYTVRYLGACLPPEVLDVPILGALAAAKRLQAAHRPSAHPRLKSWAMLPRTSQNSSRERSWRPTVG